jgi:hypothetical protein
MAGWEIGLSLLTDFGDCAFGVTMAGRDCGALVNIFENKNGKFRKRNVSVNLSQGHQCNNLKQQIHLRIVIK